MDLRAQWDVLQVAALAAEHGRSVGSIMSHAQSLGLEGTQKPVKPEKPAKPERPTKAPVAAPELSPALKMLCVAGLSELSARVLHLAAQGHSHPAIAEQLGLPCGIRSVSAHFQIAGGCWGIAGKGAHKAIVARVQELQRAWPEGVAATGMP